MGKQEFAAVKCAFCHKFQVQQVNKANKFACSLCGSKQSVLRHFAVSNFAKDVRLYVQQLNSARGEAEAALAASPPPEPLAPPQQQRQAQQAAQAPLTDWGQFVDSSAAEGGENAGHEGELDCGPYRTCVPDVPLRQQRRGNSGGGSSGASASAAAPAAKRMRRADAGEQRQPLQQLPQQGARQPSALATGHWGHNAAGGAMGGAPASNTVKAGKSHQLPQPQQQQQQQQQQRQPAQQHNTGWQRRGSGVAVQEQHQQLVGATSCMQPPQVPGQPRPSFASSIHQHRAHQQPQQQQEQQASLLIQRRHPQLSLHQQHKAQAPAAGGAWASFLQQSAPSELDQSVQPVPATSKWGTYLEQPHDPCYASMHAAEQQQQQQQQGSEAAGVRGMWGGSGGDAGIMGGGGVVLCTDLDAMGW